MMLLIKASQKGYVLLLSFFWKAILFKFKTEAMVFPPYSAET